VKLNRDEIHLWSAGLNLSSQRQIELESTLSADEIARAERFHFERDRRSFGGRRGILRAILANYLETKPSAVVFRYNEFGKPRLEDSRNSRSLSFNLSHSGELVLIAVTIDREVGVDVELIDHSAPTEQVAGRFFSVNEIAALDALPRSLKVGGFFSYWARKEAYIKARGMGLSMPLDSFDVSSIQGETVTLVVAGNSSDSSNWKIECLNIDSRYAAAVAASGRDWKVARRSWAPESACQN
jgi:4'-phosphopantetheinyl transferase